MKCERRFRSGSLLRETDGQRRLIICRKLPLLLDVVWKRAIIRHIDRILWKLLERVVEVVFLERSAREVAVRSQSVLSVDTPRDSGELGFDLSSTASSKISTAYPWKAYLQWMRR